MNRTRSRQKAFELLFSETFGINYVDGSVNDFANSLFKGVIENIKNIDELIKENIQNWNFDRISRVAKCALRIGIYEIIKNNVPFEVAVNEAVELTKIYGTKAEANYVQAVLTPIVKKLRRV
ncbi:MAG: transcription antitermination factor NusB [Firmicutes bacterium]|nr:transcription antitermination factor NusB [Bacillota bacterium]